jgi:hypothetical protein
MRRRKGGSGRTIAVMSLVAYSLRRAFSSLLVFLVVWMIQFAVSQLGPPTYIGRGGVITPYPAWLFPSVRLQPSGWRSGAVEVGMALLVLLGFVAAWTLRKRGTA